METNIHFWSYLAQLYLERKMFQTNLVEKIKIHITCSIFFFFENRVVYEITWRNIVDLGRPQMIIWRTHVSCLITKATHTQYTHTRTNTRTHAHTQTHARARAHTHKHKRARTHTQTRTRTHKRTRKHTHALTMSNIYWFSTATMVYERVSMLRQTYRGADKSLVRPGMKQPRKHVRDARDINNIETRAVIKFFFSPARQGAEGINAIMTETLACFLPGRAKDLSASLYIACVVGC